ncbi:hypothetical protein PLICRDRAFT_172589 [Plicaturopsis crispa FD-325 SS-3]|nr:hypothetical protein PLICRDRAFT_172589 [Plicaturopsis crispa FD-325 SS-3]
MSSVAGPSRPTVRSTSARAHDEEADLLDLAARLSLADVDELIGQHKGKAREGAPLSDAEIALNLFAEDARSMSLFNSDRALARSLGQEEEEVFSARLQTPPTRAPDQRQRPTRPPVARPATTAQKTQTWSQWFSSTAQSLFSNWGSSSLPPVSAPAQHFPQNRTPYGGPKSAPRVLTTTTRPA